MSCSHAAGSRLLSAFALGRAGRDRHDLAKKAERALFAIVLSTVALIMCFGVLMFR